MAEAPPLVSCLMVTSGKPDRFAAIKRSIEDYCRQSYPRRQLTIVLDAPSLGDRRRIDDLLGVPGRQDLDVICP